MKFRFLLLLFVALCCGSTALAGDTFDPSSPFIDQDLTVTAMGESVMRAELLPIAGTKSAIGSMVQASWLDKAKVYHETFRIEVVMVIPNEALGIYSLADALDADIRASIMRHGVEVECLLDVEPIMAKSHVTFAVEMMAVGDRIKPRRGICDVDTYQPGIQIGMPVLHHGDYINSYMLAKPHGMFEFLGGYCD